MSKEMLLELRADLQVVDNRFSETSKLTELAAKYGIKKAGRNRLVQDLAKAITAQTRALLEAAKVDKE